MKHHKKQYRRILIGMLLLGSTAAMMHACAWDDSLYQEFVIEDGKGGHVESCGDVLDKIIIYNDGTINTYHIDDGMFANAFAYNLCPRAAPNCMKEISDTEVPEVPEDTEAPEDTESPEESEDTSTTKFICHNCPANYNVCKNKCVETTQTNLHIKNCILDNLECDGDYYDFNKDSSDGCEFQLSINHVKENDAGTLVCVEDYFDLNKDLNNDDSSNGCEFHLSPVNIDKTRPQNSDGSWNCVNGYADLDNDRYSGCEVNGWTDNAHCGAGIINDHNQRREGEACNDGYVCKSGKCEESCGKDYIVVCDGLCSNTMIDNAHCGGCNRTCSLTANDVRAAVACQDGGCHAIACQPGYYLADGTDETGKDIKKCEPCNENEYTTSATATGCKVCPTTTGAKSMVFDANNNICKAASCLEGYQLKDGSCEPCAPGTYSKTSDTAQCKNCDMKCTECPDGHFSGHAASSCTKCPAGTYTTDHIQCINCLAGEYSDEGSNTCSDCTGDTISAAGSAMCAECKGNTHANYDHTACVGCNNASDCTLTTGVKSIQCKANVCEAATCNAGYKLVDGQCEPCEPGTYSNAGATSCTTCPNGQFSGRAASSCTKCPAGTIPNNDKTSCTNCPAGKYSNEGSNTCSDCTGETISAAGSAMCAECKGNTHANSDHTACVGCNQTNDASDNDGCVKTTGAKTMKCENNVCKAATCNAGYKLNNGQCEPCPAGSISTSDNKCTQCLAGTYAEDNECKQCPAGFYCPTEGLTSPIPCTIGHYCPAKGSAECGTEKEGTACANNHPMPCPTGTYQGERGKTSVSECLNCPKGTHNDGYGAWACSLIPAGYVGINCRNESNKEGCTQYSMCFDGNSVTKCSNTYGNKSLCVNGYCITNQTTSTSCIQEQNGCPAVECCGGTCATNNDNCGSCGTQCTGGKTCQVDSDNAWKCLAPTVDDGMM